MNKITFLFVLQFFCIGKIFSQLKEIKSIDLSNEVGFSSTTNMGLSGIAVSRKEGKTYEYIFYNTDLKETGRAEIESLNENFSAYYDSSLNKFILFHYNYKKTTHFTLTSPTTHKSKTIELVMQDGENQNFDVTSLININKSTYIITRGSKGKFEKKIYTLNLENGNVKKINLGEEWKSREILKIKKVNSKYMSIFYFDKKKFNNIALMDDNGKIIVDKLVTNKDDDFSILKFQIADVGNDQLIITGVYTLNPGEYEYSLDFIKNEGLFIAKIENLKLRFVKYLELKEIEDFQKSVGGENAMSYKKWTLLVAVHQAIVLNEQIIMAAECYVKVGNLSEPGGYYQHSNFMFFGFDKDGKKVMEQSIPSGLDFRYFSISPMLIPKKAENEIKYSAFTSKEIYSFSLSDKLMLDFKSAKLLKLGDKEKQKQVGYNCEPWYDTYFCVFIRNNPKSNKKNPEYSLYKYELE